VRLPPAQRPRRRERIQGALEREPCAAPELRCRTRELTSRAVRVSFSRLLGVGGLVCHFRSINDSVRDPDTRTLASRVDPPGHTVLVVDDDASIRFLCRVNLELDGWEVRDAGNLADAREALADGRVEVALLDVHIGGSSGLDFLDELRRDHPALPVAMLTGSVGTPTFSDVAADAVLAKPFTPEQLGATVRTLASRPARTAG
jgi:CheY-like chemotaxis protein